MTDGTTREVSCAMMLTLVHGNLLCDFAEMHHTMDFLAGHPLWTHQLVRVGEIARDHLAEQHPEVANIEVPSFAGSPDWDRYTVAQQQATVDRWVATLDLPETFTLSPLPDGLIEKVDPLSELAEMRSRATEE